MATPGVRKNVQVVTSSAYAGWSGPMSSSNQRSISNPAMNSIPTQYTKAAVRSPPPCGAPSSSTLDLALGDDSVLTRHSFRRTVELSGARRCMSLVLYLARAHSSDLLGLSDRRDGHLQPGDSRGQFRALTSPRVGRKPVKPFLVHAS